MAYQSKAGIIGHRTSLALGFQMSNKNSDDIAPFLIHSIQSLLDSFDSV